MAPRTLIELLARRAGEQPERVGFRFLTDGEIRAETLTYAELDLGARRVAAKLRERAAPGERALLLHAPGLDYITSFFGCLYAGMVAVPALPPPNSRPIAPLSDLIADTRAKVALASAGIASRVQRRLTSSGMPALDWVLPPDPKEIFAPAPTPAVTDADLAVLQYTSGSTTAPKGVMLSHGTLMSNVRMLAEHNGATHEDRLVAWLPPYHDMGLIGAILAPLYAATEVILMAPAAFLQRPLRWLEAIARYGATISGGPNFAYDLCIRRSSPSERAQLDLRTWRIAFSGAERVRPNTLERFTAAFGGAGFAREAFCPCYGLAEATLGVSFTRVGAGPHVTTFAAPSGSPEKEPRALVATGQPLPGLEVLIVDPETRKQLPAGQEGEIWVRGPSIALGYWNQPELTERQFHATLADDHALPARGFLRTGDLGQLHEGELYVTGRLKDLIILLGINHHPEDLEAALEDCHPAMRPSGSAAFAIESEEREELIVVVEVDSTRDVPSAEIESAARGALASSQSLRVDRVVIVGPGGIPRTSSGKVRRAECRARYLAGKLEILAESSPEHGTPEASAEDANKTAAIAALMAELLGLDHVDADADFFALGGHSLLATQLVSRVRDVLEIELPLRVLFESPSPRAISVRLPNLPTDTLPPISRRGGNQPKLLSFSQERMWFLQQLDPQGTAYNVAGAIVIEGPLDVAALEAAFTAVLARHDILRTNYLNVGGRPEITIAPARLFPFVLCDVSAHDDPEGEARRLGSTLAQRPFDLAHDALIRVELYRLAPECHALAASLHHVISDGWSMGVLLGEVLKYYAAQHTAAPEAPFGDAPSYLDYAAWQRRELVPRRFPDEIRYWKKQLAGATLLELPTDRPRSTRRSSAGGFEPLEFPEDLVDSLRKVGRRHGATLFMVMLAAFDTLLYRLTGTTDIVVGTPIANRTHVAAEGLVGTLVNTIAVRVEVDPEGTFSTLIARVRAAALDAWAHQELPFERLVSELGMPRLPGRSPLFEIMFDFQNGPMPLDAAGELRLRPLRIERGAAQFELSLDVLNTELGRLAGFEYNAALFDAATIRRIAEQYLTILHAVARDPDQTVATIRLLTPAVGRTIVELGTRATGAPLVAPERAFAAWALSTPTAPAVSDGSHSLTYAEVATRVEALARRLASAGAGPGERVAIFLERSHQVPIALLAVLRTGAAYVPVDPSHPDARIAHVLGDADPRLIVSESRLSARAAALPGGLPCLIIDDPAEPASAELHAAEDLDRIAYVLYTSGSTGRPKGVEVPVRALANFLGSMQREPGMTASDSLLSVTTVTFDIAALELLLPLTVGARVHVAPGDVVVDGQRLCALLESEPFTLLQATPSAYRLLLAAGFRGAERLTLLVGGEPLDRGLADQLLERAPSVWNMYGPTETTVWSTLHRVVPSSDSVLIGRPVDRTSVYILDPHLSLAPLGVAGEICIGGAGVARGYFRQPELTRERFLPDPFAGDTFGPGPRLYRTGDMGRMRADGTFECLGRADQQVKIRGHRVELGEIEVALRQAPGVRDGVVSYREVAPGDARLAAYYTTERGHPLDLEELRGALRRALPEYMVPSAFVRMDAIPLTPNGKVNKKALPEPPDSAFGSSKPRIAPRNPNERLLAELWSEALGVKEPSVLDNFFDSGGHSLLAVRLLSAVEQRTGIALSLSSLLEQPTIEELARHLGDSPAPRLRRIARGVGVVRRAREFNFLVPIQGKGNKPPLFCVHGAGGNVLNLHALGRRLGQNRPFYGIQAAGVDGVVTPFARIEEMAEAYLAELLKVQAHGPYFLSGYCGGGIVAYEMAQRLIAGGEEIALLALLDAFRPGLPLWVTPVSERLRAVSEQGPGYLWRGGQRRLFRNWHALSSSARIQYHRLFSDSVPHELREFWLMSAFLRSATHYRPHPYPRKLTVLRAKDSPFPENVVGKDLGWSDVSEGGLELYEVPGNHDTLAHEPNVSSLAETLNHCMRLAEANGSPHPGALRVGT